MSPSGDRKTILFICTHNSARSHMAEGLVNALWGDRFEAWSAGIEPAGVNPFAIEAMAEMGLDIRDHRSKSVDEFLDREFDYVVTVCDHANENCPYFPVGKEMIHQGFEDPAAVKGNNGEKLAAFRRVRDEIKAWIEKRLAG
jgi:arsenate reductase